MKITEAKLRKIILEETKIVMREGVLSSAGHLALDVAGVGLDWFWGAGMPFDAANVAWYMTEGDFFNAALSAISILPFAGDAVGKGIRLVNVLDAMKGSADLAGEVKAQKNTIGDALAEVMPEITSEWDMVADKFGDENANKMLQALQDATGIAPEATGKEEVDIEAAGTI